MRMKDADWSSLLAPTFPSGSLLSRSSLSNLAAALKGALATSPSADASGSSRPSMGSNAVKTSKNHAAPAPGQGPHFVWTLLADAYFPTESVPTPAADKVAFPIFWSVCVDQALFGSSSLPLKALGFSLIQLFLPRLVHHASAADVSAIFGPNTLRVLANHLRKDAHAGGEKTLARVAEKIVGSTVPAFLTAAASEEGSTSNANGAQLGLAIIKALVSPPHSQYNAFEPKVLDRIVAKLPLQAVKGWVAHLRSIVLEPTVVRPVTAADAEAGANDADDDEEEATLEEDASDREKRITAQRTWAFDQMLTVVRSGSVPKDDELISSLLEFLAVVGWFDVTESGSTKGARSYVVSNQDARLTGPQRLAARSRFFSCLTALVGGSVAAPLGGPNWLQRALALLDNLAADEKHFTRAADDDNDNDDQSDEDDDEARPLIERVKALYGSLDKVASAKKGTKEKEGDKAEAERSRAKTARALLEGFRLVCWDEGAADAADILEGAIDAVEALFPSLAADKQAEDDDEEEEQDGEKPEPGTILVDVVLALLRRPSAFVKAFAGPIVLKGFAGEIGQQAIELLGDVVAPADEVEDGIEADADAEEEEEAEGADKAQKKQAKGAKAGSDSDDSDDSEEDDSSDDDEDGLEVDEAFKNELLAALEAGGMGVPNAASDDDDDEEMKGDESDEEELLDDEAMLALDDRLADIFRANGGGRRSKKREWIHPRSTRVSCMTDPICSQQVTARTTCTTASVVSTCSTSSRTPSRRLRSSSRSTSPSST